MAIPGVKKTPFYQKKWFAELFGSVPPIVAVIITAIVNFQDETKRNLGIVGIIAAVWIFLAGIIKIFQASKQDSEESLKYNFEGIKASLVTLHELVSEMQNFNEADRNNGKFRVTMHRVDPSGKANEEMEQLIPYIGGEGGEAGRKFSIRSGIIGKVLREKLPYRASRQNDDREAFVQELVTAWSYPEAEARNLSEDRKSWMAIPILNKQTNVAIAIIYLDSNKKDFFNEEVIELVLASSKGIAKFIEERY